MTLLLVYTMTTAPWPHGNQGPNGRAIGNCAMCLHYEKRARVPKAPRKRARILETTMLNQSCRDTDSGNGYSIQDRKAPCEAPEGRLNAEEAKRRRGEERRRIRDSLLNLCPASYLHRDHKTKLRIVRAGCYGQSGRGEEGGAKKG